MLFRFVFADLITCLLPIVRCCYSNLNLVFFIVLLLWMLLGWVWVAGVGGFVPGDKVALSCALGCGFLGGLGFFLGLFR